MKVPEECELTLKDHTPLSRCENNAGGSFELLSTYPFRIAVNGRERIAPFLLFGDFIFLLLTAAEYGGTRLLLPPTGHQNASRGAAYRHLRSQAPYY